MITQELLSYMRAELAKGRTRDEIHQILISSGGWTENDLGEAFRVIIPMSPLPSSAVPVPPVMPQPPSFSPQLKQTSPSESSSPAPSRALKFLIILIIVYGLGLIFGIIDCR